jgi:hypothetical protein
MTSQLNYDERVVLKLNGIEIPGVVELSGLSCNDNVTITQFVGSTRSIAERGNREPYSFSVTLTVLKKDVDSAIQILLALRNLRETLPIVITRYSSEPSGSLLSQWSSGVTSGLIGGGNQIYEENILEKYGIKDTNILNFTATDSQDSVEIVLSMQEFITTDLEIEDITNEASLLNQLQDEAESASESNGNVENPAVGFLNELLTAGEV